MILAVQKGETIKFVAIIKKMEAFVLTIVQAEILPGFTVLS